MPRMGRVVLPNYPHHVVQRGHNRQVVFAEDDDFQRYIENLRELKAAFGVQVYAYCLMTNHVHLLLAPGEAVAAGSADESAGGTDDALPQPAGAALGNLVGEALQRGQLTGSNRFVDEVERIIGRRIEHRRPGRPARERA